MIFVTPAPGCSCAASAGKRLVTTDRTDKKKHPVASRDGVLWDCRSRCLRVAETVEIVDIARGEIEEPAAGEVLVRTVRGERSRPLRDGLDLVGIDGPGRLGECADR